MNEDDIRWIVNRLWSIAQSKIPEGCYYDSLVPKTSRLILRDKIYYAIPTAISEWFKTFRPNIDPYKKAAMNAILIRLITMIVTYGWKDYAVNTLLSMINEYDEM